MAWDSQIINLDDAMTRAMGRKEHYKGWLDSFFGDENIRQIEETFETGDREVFSKALHKLTGTAGNLSVTAVYSLAKEILDNPGAGRDDLEKLRDSFYAAKKMYEENIEDLLSYGEIRF
jgi:HPt (histidine-containing phosphotransfer) domain-containing protein